MWLVKAVLMTTVWTHSMLSKLPCNLKKIWDMLSQHKPFPNSTKSSITLTIFNMLKDSKKITMVKLPFHDLFVLYNHLLKLVKSIAIKINQNAIVRLNIKKRHLSFVYVFRWGTSSSINSLLTWSVLFWCVSTPIKL